MKESKKQAWLLENKGKREKTVGARRFGSSQWSREDWFNRGIPWNRPKEEREKREERKKGDSSKSNHFVGALGIQEPVILGEPQIKGKPITGSLIPCNSQKLTSSPIS
jgi:hypothetical protein